MCLRVPVCFSADTVATEYQPLALLFKEIHVGEMRETGKGKLTVATGTERH